jgi:hypothetical protein
MGYLDRENNEKGLTRNRLYRSSRSLFLAG